MVSALVREQAGTLDVPLAPLLARADPVELTTTLLRARVYPPLAAQLLEYPGLELPSWFAERAEQARTVARHRGLFQHVLLERATAVLRERDIPVVPLKGTAMAEALYGDLGSRESADLDLLVEPGRLDETVTALTSLGWTENRLAVPERGLPALHRVLEHPTHPPIEVHWRVHWYEDSFAAQALRRASSTEQGWLRLAPADELATLLLFLARDGLAGLRQVVDLAAWWGALGQPGQTGPDLRLLADRHPELEPSLTVAARWAESRAGLEPGWMLEPARPALGPPAPGAPAGQPVAGGQRAPGGRRGLADRRAAGTPRAGRRVRPPPADAAEQRDHHAPARAGGCLAVRALLAARAGHGIRVAARYVLALPTIVTGKRRAARQR